MILFVVPSKYKIFLDDEIMDAIKPWKEKIDQVAIRKIGTVLYPLQKLQCGSEECNLGNFITDAFVYYYATKVPHRHDEWTSASVALVQAGVIRTALNKGGTN